MYPYLPGTKFVQPVPLTLMDEYYDNIRSLERFGLHDSTREIRAELIARQHEIRAKKPNTIFTDVIPAD